MTTKTDKTKDSTTEISAFLKKVKKEGATAKEVADHAKVNATTARRQLADLEAIGAVRRERVGNSTRWFAGGGSGPQNGQSTAQGSRSLASERDVQVLEAIAAGDGMSVADVAAKLDVTTGLAYGSVWRLQKAGSIEKARDGSRTPLWKKAAAKAKAK